MWIIKLKLVGCYKGNGAQTSLACVECLKEDFLVEDSLSLGACEGGCGCNLKVVQGGYHIEVTKTYPTRGLCSLEEKMYQVGNLLKNYLSLFSF